MKRLKPRSRRCDYATKDEDGNTARDAAALRSHSKVATPPPRHTCSRTERTEKMIQPLSTLPACRLFDSI